MTRRLLHAAPALVAASAVGLLLVALTGFGTGWPELAVLISLTAATALVFARRRDH
ncbi:hypothetical protein [Nocardioides sp.]|uniref:hypothetical protein n=1 Tax=Nocardioides sp. TaxID=35761 RepID=UPI0035662E9A